MPINFTPNYIITSKVANGLMRIATAKAKVNTKALTPQVLASLCERVKATAVHYATKIEGNSLTLKEVEVLLTKQKHFAERNLEEREVKGYAAALTEVDVWARAVATPIHEKMIESLHALLKLTSEKNKPKSLSYRVDQKAVRDSKTHTIIYLPPEATLVPQLMANLIDWINNSKEIPAPLVAALVHYQVITIQPYSYGSGHLARLLTNWILQQRGYGLQGLSLLEDYYAQDLNAYYAALSIGENNNYYIGRGNSEFITKWLEYFVEGMAIAFENVVQNFGENAFLDITAAQNPLLRKLDIRQRSVLSLFQQFEIVTARQLGVLFGLQPRTNSKLCQAWVEKGFLTIVDFSNKGRKYKLAKGYEALIK
jgi:Fic family protein